MLGCGVMLTPLAAMGSKSKPATEVSGPKVLPESTPATAPTADHVQASAPSSTNTPVKLIENTADSNQKVHDALPGVDESAKTAQNTKGGESKAKKSSKKAKKKSSKAKKASAKKSKSKS
jgi:hypothetical protein